MNQKEVLAWAVKSFGAIANNRDERGARLAEEAIEIAQCEGVPLDIIIRIANHVYSRPSGELRQEIGGTAIALMACAENADLSVYECSFREFERMNSKSYEWWQKKHADKVAAGIANLSPVKV